MKIFPKIKKVPILYKLKIVIKNKKDFFYNLIFLIINKTPINLLIIFIKSHFLKKDDLKLNSFNVTNFTDEEIEKYVTDLAKKFEKQKILFCGPGFKNIDRLETNASICRGIHELVNFCSTV